jgi:chitodextrinase
MTTPRKSRHLLERPRPAVRRRSLLGTAGLVIGTILLGLLGTGGSFALWRGSTTVQAATVSAARVAITHTGFTGLNVTYKSTVLSATAGVQLTNTGDAAGSFSSTVSLAAGSSSTLANAITVLVWPVSALSSCTPAASSSGAVSYKWNTIPTLTGTLAPGASQVYCLRTSIPSGSLGITGSVTPTLTSVITVGGWTATATSTATQQNEVVADKTAPTAPGTPTASGTTATSTVLSWTASTDAVGVTAYDVYRNGVLVGTVASPGYTDTSLAASTTYSYTVKARDAAGNVSAASGARSVTTAAPVPSGPDSSTWYQVINAGSGKCVDANGSGNANGVIVLQWSCGTSANQQWQFRPTSGGYTQVVPRHAQTIAWDVNIDAYGSAGGTADGTPVQLWSYGGGANQQWQPVAQSDGTYHFVVKSTGKCLAMKDGSMADGATVEQRTCATTPAQAFRLVPVTW